MQTYQSLVVTRRGGPETLQFVEHDLRPPAAGEAASASWPPRWSRTTSPSGWATARS